MSGGSMSSDVMGVLFAANKLTNSSSFVPCDKKDNRTAHSLHSTSSPRTMQKFLGVYRRLLNDQIHVGNIKPASCNICRQQKQVVALTAKSCPGSSHTPGQIA